MVTRPKTDVQVFVYWKNDKIGIPQWESDAVRDDLRPFLPDDGHGLSHDMQAYCRYYGLDLWVEYPEVTYTPGLVKAGGHQVAILSALMASRRRCSLSPSAGT